MYFLLKGQMSHIGLDDTHYCGASSSSSPPHCSNTVSLSDSLSFTGDRERRAKTGAGCAKKKGNETRSHLRIDSKCPKCKIKTLRTVRLRREGSAEGGAATISTFSNLPCVTPITGFSAPQGKEITCGNGGQWTSRRNSWQTTAALSGHKHRGDKRFVRQL